MRTNHVPELSKRPPLAIACPDCDLLQEIPSLEVGAAARCARCRKTLAHRHVNPVDVPLALTIAAAIAFIVTNTTPLMALSAAGREASTTILGGAFQMWQQGSEITAVVVAFCAVIAPGGYLLFLLTVLISLRFPPAPRWVGRILRLARFLEPWSMTEVMMLGILVALFKIAQYATVIPDVGMFAAGVFVFLLVAVLDTFDASEAWAQIEWVDGTTATTISDHAPEAVP